MRSHWVFVLLDFSEAMKELGSKEGNCFSQIQKGAVCSDDEGMGDGLLEFMLWWRSLLTAEDFGLAWERKPKGDLEL